MLMDSFMKTFCNKILFALAWTRGGTSEIDFRQQDCRSEISQIAQCLRPISCPFLKISSQPIQQNNNKYFPEPQLIVISNYFIMIRCHWLVRKVRKMKGNKYWLDPNENSENFSDCFSHYALLPNSREKFIYATRKIFK